MSEANRTLSRLIPVLALAAPLLTHAALPGGSSTLVSKESVAIPLAFQLSGSTTGLGDQHLYVSESRPVQATPLAVQMELQPVRLLGLWGVGPSLEYFWTQKSGKTAPDVTLAYNVGGHVRYQAQFSDTQALVPTVSYSFQYWKYQSVAGDGNFLAQGPSVGLWVNLGFLDGLTARHLRNDYGITRSYLVFERRMITGADGLATLTGHSYNLGVRLEIERDSTRLLPGLLAPELQRLVPGWRRIPLQEFGMTAFTVARGNKFSAT